MLGYVNFKAGIAALVLGMVFIAIDIWRKFAHLALRTRIVIEALFSACCGLAAYFMFPPIPLEIFVSAPTGHYEPGSTTLGVTWSNALFPVNLTINNPSDFESTNFDAYVRTNNIFIARVGVDGGVNQCTAIPQSWLLQASLTLGPNYIPLFQDSKVYNSSIYRIRCSSVAAHEAYPVNSGELHNEPDGRLGRR
jgi:hypothetical protein